MHSNARNALPVFWNGLFETLDAEVLKIRHPTLTAIEIPTLEIQKSTAARSSTTTTATTTTTKTTKHLGKSTWTIKSLKTGHHIPHPTCRLSLVAGTFYLFNSRTTCVQVKWGEFCYLFLLQKWHSVNSYDIRDIGRWTPVCQRGGQVMSSAEPAHDLVMIQGQTETCDRAREFLAMTYDLWHGCLELSQGWTYPASLKSNFGALLLFQSCIKFQIVG